MSFDYDSNLQLSQFLNIADSDKQVLGNHKKILLTYARLFGSVLYDYLESSDATRAVLDSTRQAGADSDQLISQVLRTLCGFLLEDPNTNRPGHLAASGALHQSLGLKPASVMGVYKLFLDHLLTCIQANDELDPVTRSQLRSSTAKYIFRDMGVTLDDYWGVTLNSLEQERRKVLGLQEQISGLLANIPQLLWSFDVTGQKPLYLSPKLSQACTIDSEFPIPHYKNTPHEDRKHLEQAWFKALQGQTVEVEGRVQLEGQPVRWYKRLLYPFTDSQGKVVRIDGIMEDITELKSSLERLNALATTDSLTGLTNRLLFNDRLDQALAMAERSSHKQLAVLLMDLNHFKEINDTLGHQVGDDVLIQVSQRLKQQVNRRSDTLARLGGDEFGVVLTNAESGSLSAEHVCLRIQQAFEAPFQLEDREVYLGMSIGVALYPSHGMDASTLMRRADVAMYAAKRSGGGFNYYEPEQDMDAQQNFSLTNDLRQALKNNELYLQYQPKVRLADYSVASAEALLRWQHPERGVIPPAEFIPIAERSGLINPLTEWVIDNALKQVLHWRRLGVEVSVAVNISAKVFHQWGNLTLFIHRALRRYELPGSCLEIEITENVLMSDLITVRKILNQIAQLGVTIAIDDFGTGYSSLAYLKSLPLNTLKIDKSFVLDMIDNENDAMIVKSTVDLAHNLGLNVVAEGIEDSETLNLLGQWRCDDAQGFYLAKPMSAMDFVLSFESGVFDGGFDNTGSGV